MALRCVAMLTMVNGKGAAALSFARRLIHGQTEEQVYVRTFPCTRVGPQKCDVFWGISMIDRYHGFLNQWLHLSRY